ncbi:MAG: XrtA/PEP-CTERM system histidine kinase PrsK [Thermodesulfobacteriota bacterium]
MGSLAIIGAGNAMVLLSNAEGQIALLGMRLALIGQAILPVTWLLFSIVFARANYKEILSKWRPFLLGTATASFFFVLWVGSSKFISLSSSGLFILGSVGRYFYIYLLLGLVLNLIHLENTLRSSSGSKRGQIKYVIFGVGAILAFFIYLISHALLFSTLNIQTIPVISVVILICTSMIALFIVRHRLLDIDIYISRYVVFNSLTVLIVGFYLLTVGIITYGIKYLDIPFNYFFTTLFIFISILVLVVLFFTDKLRRKVQLFINRHFYKHKYDFREQWMETIEKISTKRSLDEIQSTLTEMVSESMGAKDIYLWLYDPVSRDYLITQDKLVMTNRRISNTHPLVQHMKTHMGPFMVNELLHNQQSKDINTLKEETKAVLCAPLVVGQEIIGFILQGEDSTGEPYIQNDFEILKAMTTQAAVQLKNIRLAQDLIAAREVEVFHRMSSFIMHDLKNLSNSLSLVSQNAKYNMDNPEFQQDTIKTLNNTVSRMKRLIERLSTVPKALELKREAVELNGLVHNAVKKIALFRTKSVTITKEIDGVPPIYVDPQAMETVFLNLLTNAYEAILREGKIRVQATVSHGNVNITIADNGTGMSEEYVKTALFQPFKTTKKGGFGIGLYQCKTVVEAHGGKIEVKSVEGNGTSFTVTLPVG